MKRREERASQFKSQDKEGAKKQRGKDNLSTEAKEKQRLATIAALSEIDQLFDQQKKEQQEVQKLADEDERKKRARNSKMYEDEEEAMLVPLEEFEDPSTTDASYGLISSSRKKAKIRNPEAPLERIDKESGLPVYKAHLLKVGEGGGTPLCPFDCDCCF